MNRVPVIAAPPRSGRPCWHCAHFARMIYAGSADWCTLPHGPRVQAGPCEGCSARQRVLGVDDELGPLVFLKAGPSSAVRPFAMPLEPLAWTP